MDRAEIRKRLLALTSRPNGLYRGELTDRFTQAARPISREVLNAMLQEGAVIQVTHPRRVSTGPGRLHCFSSRAMADAWMAGPPPGSATKHKQKALTVMAPKPKAAPSSDEAFKAAEPRITSRTRVTVAQTPPPRFYVSAAPRITNPAECRPWAAAAAASIGG